MVMDCLCSGLHSGGVITVNAGGQGIDITPGKGDINNHTGITGEYGTVPFGAFTNVQPAGDGDNFVAIHLDGSLDVAQTRQALGGHVYLGHFWSQGGYVLAVFPVAEWSGHFVGMVNEFLADGIGGILHNGSCIVTSSGLDLSMTSGEGYFRGREFLLDARTDFMTMYNTSGSWAQDNSTPNLVNTTHWNNVSTGLVALTADYWTKHLLILIPDYNGGTLHVVLGQAEYATKALADAGPNPVIPDAVSMDSANIYTITVQEASLNISGGLTRSAPVMADLFGKGSAAPGAGVAFASITGNATDNTSLVSAVSLYPNSEPSTPASGRVARFSRQSGTTPNRLIEICAKLDDGTIEVIFSTLR
jgi:hypothetical protein